MEVRAVSQRQSSDHIPLPSQLPFEARSLYLKTRAYTKTSLKKHFRGIALRWRIQLQDASNGQHSSKYSFVHVVREGETLTSISRKYGVSVYALATANSGIVDPDLVFIGQLVNIPARGDTRVIDDRVRLQGNNHGYLNRILDPKQLVMTSHLGLPNVKQTGYFLVLVPLAVFCIRCIIAASYTQLSRASRHESQNKSQHQGSKSGRWRSALFDMSEPEDIFSTESNAHCNRSNSEDEAEITKEMSEAYEKLEHDYRKFLAHCGISKWGYWRGGTGGSTE